MELYGNGYQALTKQDAKEIMELNCYKQWGISKEEYMNAINEHREARQCGNIRTMEKIEFRLEDINFHSACRALCDGKYDEAIKKWED